MSATPTPSINLSAIRKELEEEKQLTEMTVMPRSLDIEVRYTSPEGEHYTVILNSSIKTGEQRAQVVRTAAKLSGGTPWELMPAIAQARLWALANVSVQIVDPPAWFYKWVEEDDQLLWGIANQLEEHERRFFRGDSPSRDGNSQSSRLVVRSELTSTG